MYFFYAYVFRDEQMLKTVGSFLYKSDLITFSFKYIL